MLETLLEQIKQFDAIGEKTTVRQLLKILLARLKNISVMQLESVPAETMNKLIGLIEKSSLDEESLDWAVTILTNYNKSKRVSTLLDMETRIMRALAEERRRTLNTVMQDAYKRVNNEEARRSKDSLLLICKAIEKAETAKRGTGIIGEQAKELDRSLQEFYRRHGRYWKLKEEHEGKINVSVKQDLNTFVTEYTGLVKKAKEFCNAGLYLLGRDCLAFKGEVNRTNLPTSDYPLDKLLAPLVELNNEEIQLRKMNKLPEASWRVHRRMLNESRQKAQEKVGELKSKKVDERIKSLQQIQEELRKTHLEICQSIFKKILLVLGTPPCKISIILFGSQSRGDVNSLSDIEFSFLMEDPKNKKALAYIQNFLHLWNQEMVALGESESNKSGFSLDIGTVRIDNNKEDTDFTTLHVQTPAQYAQDVVTNLGIDTETDNTKLRPILLFGDENLYNEAIDRMRTELKEQNHRKVCSKIAKTIQNPQLLNTLTGELEKKKTSLQMLVWCITQLAIKHGLPKTHSNHPFDILNWLVEQEILDKRFTDICRDKLCWLYEQRLIQALGISQLVSSQQEKVLKYINDVILVPFSQMFGWMIESKQRNWPRKMYPGYYPRSNGERSQLKCDLSQWQQIVNKSYLVKEAEQGLPVIKIRTIGIGEGYLHPVVIKHLQMGGWIDARGRFNFEMKKANQGKGDHLVVPSLAINPKLYMIVFPILQGMDYAASKFCQLVTGMGLPFVDIAHFECDREVFPIVLSEALPGETMDIVLRAAEKFVVDRKSFTIAFLLTLLLNPGNQTPDKIIHLPKAPAKLFLINNRQSFNSVTDENWSTISTIYCLDQMNETLDDNVIEEFLNLDPYLLLHYWLQDLERAEAVNIMPIPIREGIVTALYNKMLRLQEVLDRQYTTSDQPEKKLTALDVLKEIEPQLGRRYGELLDKYPDPLARFNAGPGQAYAKSSEETQSKPGEVKRLLNGEKPYVQQAIKELRDFHELYQKQKEIVERITNGDANVLKDLEGIATSSIRQEIFNHLDFSVIKTPPEKLYKTMERTCFVHLCIVNSSLSEDQLEKILKGSPNINELTLRNLPNIGSKLWLILDKYGKHLEKLHINNLPNLTWHAKSKTKLEFPKIAEVEIKSCNKFESLSFAAKEMQALVVRDCRSLNELAVTTGDKFRLLDVTGCVALSGQSVKDLKSTSPTTLQVIGAADDVRRAIFLSYRDEGTQVSQSKSIASSSFIPKQNSPSPTPSLGISSNSPNFFPNSPASSTNPLSRDSGPTGLGRSVQAFFTRGVAPSSKPAPTQSAASAASAAASTNETRSPSFELDP